MSVNTGPEFLKMLKRQMHQKDNVGDGYGCT